MKLAPNTQYTLAFWSITGPLLIPFAALILIAIVNPLWFRNDMIQWIERLARAMAQWRDDTKFVKHYYDKAHLFDKLKA